MMLRRQCDKGGAGGAQTNVDSRLQALNAAFSKDVTRKLTDVYKRLCMEEKLFGGKELHVQHSAVVAFVREANGKHDILEKTALKFLDAMDYVTKRENSSDMSKDQIPALITISNYALSHRVINHGVKDIDGGVLYNGTFSLADNVSRPEDVAGCRYYDAVNYIINHALENPKRLLPPYMLFIEEADKEGSAKFESVARLAIAKRDKLMADAEDAGKTIIARDTWHIEQGIRGADGAKTYREERVFVPAVVYCAESRTYHVVDHEGDGEKIGSVRFDKWDKLGKMKRQDIVRKHLDNMEKHMKHDKDYAGYLRLMKVYAETECADSRRFKGIAKGVIKSLGGLFSDSELLEIMKDPARSEVKFNIHTFCGYINTTIKVDAMLREIAELTQDDPALKRLIIGRIEKILRGERAGVDFSSYYGLLKKNRRKDENGELVYGLSEGSKQVLIKLFKKSDEDMRSLIRNTANSKLVTINEETGLPRMSAAMEIDSVLGKFGSGRALIGDRKYSILVMEEVAHGLYERIIALSNEHEETIKKARGGSQMNFSVVLADIKHAVKWNLRPACAAKSLDDLLSTEREDAITLEPVDISHLYK